MPKDACTRGDDSIFRMQLPVECEHEQHVLIQVTNRGLRERHATSSGRRPRNLFERVRQASPLSGIYFLLHDVHIFGQHAVALGYFKVGLVTQRYQRKI